MEESKIYLNREKPIVALVTNHDDDVYCFRKELIEGIREAGYDVLISCPYGEKLDLMKDIKFEHDNVYIERRGMNPISDFKLLIHYYEMMRRYKPDIILIYTIKPNIYASLAAASLGIPYINNVTGFGSILNMRKSMQEFILILFKVAFRKSSCVFFQNEENMKLALRKGLVHENYKLIPGSGVNTNRFPLQNYPDGGDGVEGEKIVFNYIGRVMHDKGVDDYIEAAIRIKEKYENVEFNILGFIEPTEKSYEYKLEKLNKANIIIYRGEQKDIKPFIARSHATIHPSTYGEGMSNVLLESAASGRVLITTDNCGCCESVNDDETGFIYRGGRVDELVKKIEKFLKLNNEMRKKMGIAGREKIKNEFSREIVVEEYLKKIKTII